MRSVLLALAFAAVSGAFAWFSPMHGAVDANEQWDGHLFTAASRASLSGDSPYDREHTTREVNRLRKGPAISSSDTLPFPYPPIALLVLWPFGLPGDWSRVGHTLFIFISAFAFLFLTFGLVRRRIAEPRSQLLLQLCIGLCPLLVTNAQKGQTAAYCAAAVALAITGMETQSPRASATGLSLLLIKPHYAAFALMGLLLRGPRKLLFWVTVALAAAAVLTWAFFPSVHWHDFYREASAANWSSASMPNVVGTVAWLGQPTGTSRLWIAAVAFSAIALFIKRSHVRGAAAVALCSVVPLVWGPSSHLHDWLIWIPCLLTVAPVSAFRPRMVLLWALGLLLLPVIVQHAAAPLGFAVGIALLILAGAWSVKRSSTPSPSHQPCQEPVAG